ncbi:hypothetical protein BDR07DRAFT_1427243 [Suillus spraguei]|nr:hypothetical protein BDR07DRAFT_1427243 [Suillus spraguei]
MRLIGGRTQSDRPIHLSFDIYVLDPSVAPSTGTPAIHKTRRLNPVLADAESVRRTVTVGCSSWSIWLHVVCAVVHCL